MATHVQVDLWAIRQGAKATLENLAAVQSSSTEVIMTLVCALTAVSRACECGDQPDFNISPERLEYAANQIHRVLRLQ
jgi:hypothetical protein